MDGTSQTGYKKSHGYTRQLRFSASHFDCVVFEWPMPRELGKTRRMFRALPCGLIVKLLWSCSYSPDLNRYPLEELTNLQQMSVFLLLCPQTLESDFEIQTLPSRTDP
jgi:hypothetical protein